jgi:hypothetical protein
MPIRTQLEIPKTESRHRWNFNIRAGLDLESTLGIPNQATELAAIGSEIGIGGVVGSAFQNLSGLAGLTEVGTIESIDIGQKRDVTQRSGFNSNPLQPFQTVPHGSIFALKLSRVVLKKLPEVEASFQFLPSNLLLQQLPFVIEMVDAGDGDPSTFIRHLIYGCWFSDTNVRYDVVSKDDTRLIQGATIIPGRVLTFDPSFAGNPAIQGASALAGLAFQAIQSNEAAKNLLEDFELG